MLMDNKRRVKDMDLSSTRPWPVLQRRRIERLKDQRLEEFERACGDNFDWLENYYQGCVYAARQNKHRLEQRHSAHSTFSDHRSIGLVDMLQGNTYQQGPARTSENSPTFYSTCTVDQHQQDIPSSPDPDVDEEERETQLYMKALTAAESSVETRANEAVREMLAESQLQRPHKRPKTSSVHFQLQRPPTPKSHVHIHSPRSPYERHRITPKRTRLRVDASAATRKALRAMKVLQKRTGSGTHRRSASMNGGIHAASINDSGQASLHYLESHGTQATSHFVTVPQGHHVSLQDSEITRMSSRTASTNLNYAGVNDDGIAYQTPASDAGQYWVSHSESWGHTLTHNADEGDEENSDHTTSRSRARDSIILLSPRMRSASYRDRSLDLSLSLTPAFVGSLGCSAPLVNGRESDVDMDANRDEEAEIRDVTYDKPRSSPFHNSAAPVHFDSPTDERKRKTECTDSLNNRILIQDSTQVVRNASKEDLLADNSVGRPHLDEHLAMAEITAATFSAQSSSAQVNTATSISKPTTALRVSHSTSVRVEARGGYHSEAKSTTDQGQVMKTSHEKLQDQGQTMAKSERSFDRRESSDQSDITQMRRDTLTSLTEESAYSHTQLGQPDQACLPDNAVKPKDISLAASIAAEAVSGEATEQDKRSQDVLSSKDSVYKNTTIGSIIHRSRVATVLPEKRTLGLRRPPALAINSHISSTGSHMPPSRLLKLASALPATTPTLAHSQSALAISLSHPSSAHTVNSALKIGSGGLVKDPLSATQAVQPKATSGAYSLTSNLIRSGAARSVLPSTRAAESGLTRTENTASLQPRKPVLNLKSASTLKKPTRPVLTDSIMSVKPTALSVLSSGPTKPPSTISPRKEGTRDVLPSDLKRRELPSDSATGTRRGMLQSVLKVAAPVATHASNTMSSSTSDRDNGNGSSGSSNLQDAGHVDLANPFLAPTPVRPVPLPTRAHNQLQRQSFHEKTVLPEIESDDEDNAEHEKTNNSSRHSGIPDWASWEELEKAMHAQSHMNPEAIFGPLPMLDMTEIFPGKGKRFRARTSSAHWGAADRLTAQEITRYNEDMGWSSKD
ncbi:hypothetical protein EDD11_006205 [Mortierella claussenii]|nr:hypothetical protein EDD11_006205 [Mortierella claussenii]